MNSSLFTPDQYTPTGKGGQRAAIAAGRQGAAPAPRSHSVFTPEQEASLGVGGEQAVQALPLHSHGDRSRLERG